MASSQLIDLLLPWTQSGQEAERKRKKLLDADIDYIRELKSTAFSRMTKAGNLAGLRKEWMESWSYQLQVTGKLTTSTITFSGYLMGQPISADSMRQHIKPRTILQRADGLQVIVSSTSTDVDYDNLTAVVAEMGNSGSLTNDSGPVTWWIVSDSYTDYDTNWNPKAIDRSFRNCGSQTLKEFFEVPWLKKIIAMENFDDVADQIKEIMNLIAIKQQRMVLWSRPQYSAGQYVDGYQIENPTMKGLYFWREQVNGEYPVPNCYINKAGVSLDPDDINTQMRSLMYEEKANFDIGDWVLLIDPITQAYINDWGASDRLWYMKDNTYGYKVNFMRTGIGKDLEILVDPQAVPGKAAICELSAFRYGYLKGDPIRTVEIAQQTDRVDRLMITGSMWGTQCRNPRQKVGLIYGLPTTYA